MITIAKLAPSIATPGRRLGARSSLGRVYWTTHESNATARRLYDAVAAYRGFIRYQIDLG